MKLSIPKEVTEVVSKLQKNGFEAYVVGGCVRDLLLDRKPEDWDVTTNAKPEEIQKIFPDHFYENKFFTVTVQTESKDANVQNIEVTTYRSDHKYEDARRPGEVKYAKTLEEDLSRRDFTVNALALDNTKNFVDPFEGQQDLKEKQLRTVGVATERFEEDALRMMRAARLATVLDFTVEEETKRAIQKNAANLKKISAERIREEFVKIIMADRAKEGIELLQELGLLSYIMPELVEGIDVSQNKHHKYTVWEHNLLSLEYAAKEEWNVEVRLASLLHDIAKPRVKQGEGPDSTFYNHEVLGSNIAKQILSRLKFSKKEVDYISKLIRYHMFYYNVDEVSDSSVRRLVRKLGAENMEDLLKLRMADRIGSGVPKAQPYKLRHWQYVIEKVSQDPLSSSMLAVDGKRVMEMGKLEPGPQVGHILNILLAEVLDDPKKNTKKYLEKQVQLLLEKKEKELEKLAEKAKENIEAVDQARDEETKKKYFVQ